MWHCAVSVVLDLGGTPIRVGSTHLSSFDMNWAVQDVAQLLRVFNTGTVPGLLGGDFNGIGSNSTYDPDPYIGVPWHPDHAYQLTDTGTVDRRPAHRLEADHLGRMRDCARMTATPWAPTSGHHSTDSQPARRLDRWYTTYDFPSQAVTRYTVADPAQVGELTDHLPIMIDINVKAML